MKPIIQRSLRTRRNAVTTVQEFQPVPKTAWITEEAKLEVQEREEKKEL